MPGPARPDSLLRGAGGTGSPVARAFAFVGAAFLLLQMGPAAAQGKLLPTEEAFRFSARALDPRTVEATFLIADGYYLYRDKLRFAATTAGVAVGPVALPPGKAKEDQFFGKVETYRDRVVVRVPVDNTAGGETLTVRAESQGCADVGVCYPPNAQAVTLTMPKAGAPAGPVIDATPPKKRWFN